MTPANKKLDCIFFGIGLLPVTWLALRIAPYLDGGLPALLQNLPDILHHPFILQHCDNSLKAWGIFLFVYAIGIGVYFSARRNYRRGTEHGSAAWGSPKVIDRNLRQQPDSMNKLMTQHIAIGLDTHQHMLNLNTIVCGGSGAGKTRFYCKPNLMQCNTSFVILDPKGEILRDTGHLLEKKGYTIRVLDLISMEKSHGYNPFAYIQSDSDIQVLATNLFKSTMPKGARSNDPFWDTTASMLLMALIAYLHTEAPPSEQNFSMVLEMLRSGSFSSEEEVEESPLDHLFNDLRDENPHHIALKYYDEYHSSPAKTIKSIQITLAARLEKFNLDCLASLTAVDELHLETLGEQKTALFALIPDNDTSYNFLISILYTQLFQVLFYRADNLYPNRCLPIPVHFLMDEFANVCLPEDFAKILSVMRSRNVFVSIILQNLSQLKALFKDDWESIMGNCDQFLYLGGNEQSTHKYIAEALGDETIDLNTYGKSSGRGGSYSTNYQISGRKLLKSDEVRMLDNQYAILFVRGQKPVIDRKYDLMKHPYVSLTADGSAPLYCHGQIHSDVASIQMSPSSDPNGSAVYLPDKDYELLSEEELEREFWR